MTGRAAACWDPPPPAPGAPVRLAGAIREQCDNAPPLSTDRQRRRARIRASFHLRDLGERLDRHEPDGWGWPADTGLAGWFDDDRTCRRCGCTTFDCGGCVERTGEPCWWAEEDLCSACAAEVGA